jgi:hypothetical protein
VSPRRAPASAGALSRTRADAAGRASASIESRLPRAARRTDHGRSRAHSDVRGTPANHAPAAASSTPCASRGVREFGTSAGDRHPLLEHAPELSAAPADVGDAVPVGITAFPGRSPPPGGCGPVRSLADSRSAGALASVVLDVLHEPPVENRGRCGIPATDVRLRAPPGVRCANGGQREKGGCRSIRPRRVRRRVSPGRACPGRDRSPSGRSGGRGRCPCRRRDPGRARSRGRRSAGSGARSARP